jgi:4-amino-4-deoxy-L-arabinose transferase-like glycosyltransferase
MFRLVQVYIAPIPITPDEAQYWYYGQNLAWGYYSKPPMLPFIIRLGTEIFGDTPFGVRFFIPILHFLNAILIYKTTQILFKDNNISFWSSVTYSLLPAVSLSACLATTDPVMMFGWCLALYCFVKIAFEQVNLFFYVILQGFAIAFGLLGKYTMIAYIGSALLAMICIYELRNQKIIVSFLSSFFIAVTLLIPHILWNATEGFVTVKHLGENAAINKTFANPLQFLEFFISQLGVFGPILFTALLYFVVKNFKKILQTPYVNILLFFTFPLLIIICIQAFLSRAHANWASASYITASILIIWLAFSCNKCFIYKKSTTIHIFAALFIFVIPFAYHNYAPHLPHQLDASRRYRAMDIMTKEVLHIRESLGNPAILSTDRKLVSLLIYYGKLNVGKDILFWNSDQTPHNHYEMVGSLLNGYSKPLLYIVQGHYEKPQQSPTILKNFSSVKDLTTTAFTTHSNRNMVMKYSVLNGFKGY